MGDAPVHGSVERGFEPVRAAFAHGFEHGELGAAACAYVDGRKVVDLWGGWADVARTRAWRRDTIVNVYSATKGMTATCAHRLIERGLLGLDKPLATYWPEFAQAGKDKITMRMVLSHQAGLQWAKSPVPPEKRFDWHTVTTALAASAPVYEPGTRSEYHGGTFGYLVGEVLRRIDHRTLPEYFRQEIAEPLAADLMIAVDPKDDDRCAEMTGPEDMVGAGNSRAWRRAGDGAATAVGTADGLARVYASLARGGELGGVRVLRSETIDAAAKEQPLLHADGPAGTFGLGYQLLWKVYPGLPTGTFGHTGLGGSIGLADPSRKLGFGYVMNKAPSEGAAKLLVATYRALAAA